MDLAICGYIANKFNNADSQYLMNMNNLIDLILNQTPKTPELLDGANRLRCVLLAIFSTRMRSISYL